MVRTVYWPTTEPVDPTKPTAFPIDPATAAEGGEAAEGGGALEGGGETMAAATAPAEGGEFGLSMVIEKPYEEEGVWVLMDEPPKVTNHGAPGEIKPLAVNFVRRLGSILNREAILGAGTGSYFSPGSPSTASLSSHSIDLLSDAALYLWHDVAMPMLAQLDAADADAPLRLKSDGAIGSSDGSTKVSGWGVYCYDFLLLPSTS